MRNRTREWYLTLLVVGLVFAFQTLGAGLASAKATGDPVLSVNETDGCGITLSLAGATPQLAVAMFKADKPSKGQLATPVRHLQFTSAPDGAVSEAIYLAAEAEAAGIEADEDGYYHFKVTVKFGTAKKAQVEQAEFTTGCPESAIAGDAMDGEDCKPQDDEDEVVDGDDDDDDDDSHGSTGKSGSHSGSSKDSHDSKDSGSTKDTGSTKDSGSTKDTKDSHDSKDSHGSGSESGGSGCEGGGTPGNGDGGNGGDAGTSGGNGNDGSVPPSDPNGGNGGGPNQCAPGQIWEAGQCIDGIS